MGLMLSVLVFCVGVAEVLDCWHHFLLHLVQPQYNPLPYHLDSKTDILSEKQLGPPPECRRPSHVNICWPKDLSPNDDLHVIKRRSHSESERNIEHDVEALDNHAVGKFGHHDKYIDASECARVEISHPEIVVHSPDTVDYSNQDSPVVSRDNSPNHLELSVILESDSSSEMDEPSQIENLAYIKDKIPEFTEGSVSNRDEESAEVTKELESIAEKSCQEKETNPILNYGGEVTVPRPSCPSSLQQENISGNGSYVEAFDSSPTTVLEQFSMPDLPVFTDYILSDDVKRVSCRYPVDDTAPQDFNFLKDFEELSNVGVNSSKIEEITGKHGLGVHEYSTENEPKNTFSNEKITEPINNLPIEAILDEGLEPISEFPEIRLVESSPILMVDSSDSSLNTSDASWMVKSKTSDRPLIVRFSPSPEDMAKDFMSVTKTDLQGLGIKDSESKDSSVESAEESLIKEPFCDTQGHSKSTSPKTTNFSETQQTEGFVKPESCPNEYDLPNELYIDEQRICDIDSKVSSVNQVQLDTNSSSSSLSGIPQLPDDTKEFITHTTLPSDNGYGNEHLETPERIGEQSVSVFGDLVQSSLTKISSNVGIMESTIPSDKVIDSEKVDINKKLESNVLPLLPLIQETVNNISHVDEAIKKDFEILSKDRPVTQPTNNNSSISSDGSINKKDFLEIPPEGSRETASPEKEFPSTQKDKTSKKRKSKSSTKESLKDNSSGSENLVVLCQAMESDEEDYADNRANIVSVTTSPPPSEVTGLGDEPSAKPGPSTSTAQDGAAPSISKSENPEEKAFWLIFSGEYTKAMNKDWHSGHFCCWQCDESLTGQRYVLRDEHPYCIKCYESVFANGCEECNKTIGIDSKDLSYKDKHWHEACFLCNKCRVSLVDKQFGSKLDKIFCGNCYDAQFASRCDGCGQIFKAGTKKMEYKTRQWHEPCFACCVCKSPIGTKSFIPREQEIYCATCYEEKFATRCVKCNKIITSGGVTYKNEPWHRECFTCTNCNTSLAGQRFTSRDEKPYCADCFGELFAKRCTACCKPITGIGGTRFISFEDRHWHNDCFICASCKTSLVGRGFITDGDDIICPECAKQKLM